MIYRIAPIVFIGGSLVEHGGQRSIEAAKLGAAIVTARMSGISPRSIRCSTPPAAPMVADTGKLTVQIGAWLQDAEARKNVAQTGLQAMEPLTGALERTVAALDPYLMQFGLERRVGQANSADNA